MPSRDNSLNPMTVTAPTGGILAGTLKLISNILYFCPEAIGAGSTGPGYWKDTIVRGAPKATGQAWAKGQRLYWSTANSNLTTTATGNTLRGFAAEAALSADTTGDIELHQLPA
jgi:predicted RecA/RadA family phage recombinase